MAGRASDGQLSAVRFARATQWDEVELRRLLRQTPMSGAVRLTLEREPSYFHGASLAGAREVTIVAHERERLVCMGRCWLREAWVDGHVAQVAYLAELRLAAAARGRFGLLRGGYAFFEQQPESRTAKFHFTSISSDNAPARRLLEHGVRGLPGYAFLAELATLLIAVPPRSGKPRLPVSWAMPADLPEIVALLNAHNSRHQLATVWSVEKLAALAQHGLPLERFLVARESSQLIACGAVWDQRSFRQTVVRGYSRLLAAARPLLNAASLLLRQPRLPAVGVPLAHAFLSPLAVAQPAGSLLTEFIASALSLASPLGLEFLTIALHGADPRLQQIRRRFATRTYLSRLYRVNWPERDPSAITKTDASFLPDAALL